MGIGGLDSDRAVDETIRLHFLTHDGADRGEALLRRFEEIHCGTWVSTGVRSLHKRHFDHGFWLYPEASGMRSSIVEWCNENLGPSRSYPHTRWFEEAYVFWFRSSVDATAFKLRWM